LGSILLDAERVIDLCTEAGLDADAFYPAAHRALYAALFEMAREGVAIDLLTVTERLRALNRLDTVGGAAALEALVDATPTAAHAEYYIDIVRQKSLLRAILDCTRRSEQSCYEEAQSADSVLSRVEQSFLNLSERHHGVVQSWSSAVKATMERIERLRQLGPGGFTGISTGFRNLDRYLRGLNPGDMIVLAARPSMGKTSLAMNVCECVTLAQDGTNREQPLRGSNGRKRPVGFFSLEMSQESLAMRMLCGRAAVPGFQLESGLLNPEKVSLLLTRAADDLNKAPLFVDDTGGLDVLELRARSRRMRRKHNVEMIVIDYLQLLNCREVARQGRQQETAAISAQIKAMAKELKVPVIVLSQLSRAPEQRVGEKTGKPKLSDLRDSGAIEQDADVVLLLRRPCKYPGDKDAADLNLAIVDVAKHRNGPTGEARLNFDEKFTRFTDRADDRAGDLVEEDGAGAGDEAPVEDLPG
jgi:replicative DNA helicase